MRATKPARNSTYDFPMRFLAHATSAAPTFFEPKELKATTPHGGLVDGGVFANNPTMCGYVEMKMLRPDVEDVLVVSLGTGRARGRSTTPKQKDSTYCDGPQPRMDTPMGAAGIEPATSRV